MPRIPFIDKDNPDPQVKELLDWVTEVEGRVPNHFLVELHFPEHFKTWLTWVRTLWGEGELTFKEVQHVGIAISKVNQSPYCTGSFCAVLQHGGGEDPGKVQEYLDRGLEALDERERVFVEFALKANDDPHGVTSDDIERLRQVGLTEKGIVQLIWLVNQYSSSNRLTTILDVDFDPENDYQRMAESVVKGAGR